MSDQEQNTYKKGKGRNPLDEKEILDCKVHSRLTKDEFQRLNDLLDSSANVKTMSDLIRRILNNRHVIVYTRDKSLDEIISEITKLRKEINRIGTNFNQTVKILNTYKGSNILKSEVQEILQTVNDINNVNQNLLFHFDKAGKKWLQESLPE